MEHTPPRASQVVHGGPAAAFDASGRASDPVIRLRAWGTDRTCELPGPPFPDRFIEAWAGCAPRLTDLRASPGPRLTYLRQQWWIQDFGNQNNLQQDGIPREVFALDPGVEIRVGRMTLIAESLRSVAMRDFCIRLLGRQHEAGGVDQALRALRLATHRRAALVLCGEGDLVPIAYALHCRTLGRGAPFVVCDRRRRNVRASVRSPANHQSGVAAWKAAAGGSLCVRGWRPPHDASELLARLHEPTPECRVQLVVCSNEADHHLLAGPAPIRVSPLRDRMKELPRLVEAYAGDALATLAAWNAPPGSFTNDDLQWVIEHAATSLPEIEKATLRVVALKVSSNNVTQAAGMLGMAPISLVRWLYRRSQPPAPPAGAPPTRGGDQERRSPPAVESSRRPGRGHAPRPRR